MTDLEQALTGLGRDIELPPTPSIAQAVRRRLAERPGRRRLAPPSRRTLALAFAVLLVAVGAVLAVPPARTAVLEWLGLRGATIERAETLPTPSPQIGVALQLGRPVTLAGAGRQAAFRVVVPEALGDPDEVHYSTSVPGGRISLVYKPQEKLPPSPPTNVGLLVTQYRGDLAPEFTGKVIDQATVAEQLTVDGFPAIWLEGGPHVVFFRATDGTVIDDTVRLAGNTLLLERGSVLVRLEGSFDRAQAVEIAASLVEADG